MSVRQVEYQVHVTKKRAHTCSLDVEQGFGYVINEITNRAHLDVDGIHEVLRRLKSNSSAKASFVSWMDEHCPNHGDIICDAINASIRLYYHSETVHGSRIGRVDLGASIWERVYREMLKTVFIHPEIYTYVGRYPLSKSIPIIEECLDAVIYNEVPTRFPQVPTSTVVPLTPENLAQRRTVHPNVRRAPSAISMNSSMHDGNSVLDQDDVRSVLSMRQRRADNSRISDTVSAHTSNGRMEILIPSEVRKPRS